MKKFLSVILALVMVISILPVSATEATEKTITAYITISHYGEIVNDKNNAAVAAAPVELSGKESYNLDDLFIAAHDLYYDGGAAAGYSSYEGSWGLAIGTLWGDTSGNAGYQINGGTVYVMGLTNEVNDGDFVDVYIMQSYSENYTYFDSYTKTADVGNAITLTLMQMGYDENYNTVYSPCTDATITINGEETTQKTDGEGNASLTFNTPGKYVVSAIKSNGDLTAISAPVCVVTITMPKGYTLVTIKAAPSTADVKFYNCDGFDDNKKDILGEEITPVDKGVINDYHTYTLTLKEGRYSYRGSDENGCSLGGMTFVVDGTKDNMELVLRQVDVYTTTKYDGSNYATENEYTTSVADYEEYFATVGAPYKSGNYTRYPYLLCAFGNSFPYSVEIIPNEDIAETYMLGKNTMLGFAVTEGTTITTKTGALPALIDAVITAPDGANVQVFKQIKNFYKEEIECFKSIQNNDNTTDYIFRLPKSNGSHTYRATMEGKMTKGGYLSLKSEEEAKTVVDFNEYAPSYRPTYDKTTPLGKRGEDSVILNINKQNYLRLNEGEEFTARTYRAIQIINSDTGNVMIEPDFHYSIISGDSIVLEQQGHKAVIKGVKEGVSIVEVTYDAIEITGSANYSGIYGAIDPNRKGLFVVNVGGNSQTAINMTDWDSDFDTVYFTGEQGEFLFKPECEAAITVSINEQIINANSDGGYTIPITVGNNIVKVSAENITEYLVVKGDKVTINIENITNPDNPIKQGDTIEISFDGLHMPVPKMGGMYNPGYKKTIKAEYTLPDGSTVTSSGAQYDFISNNTITLTAYDEGSLKLTNGSIPLTCMGMEIGGHRFITDEGIPANFNAAELPGRFSILPDVEIHVDKADKTLLTDTAFDGNVLTLTFASPDEQAVNIFAGAYNDINLDGLICNSVTLDMGKNIITVDCSSLADKELYMMIWDKDMTEITAKTLLIKD